MQAANTHLHQRPTPSLKRIAGRRGRADSAVVHADVATKTEAQLELLRVKLRNERVSLTLFRAPLRTLWLLLRITSNAGYNAAAWLNTHLGLVGCAAIAVACIPLWRRDASPAARAALDDAEASLVFAAYWIALGVASSVGLGTGLHTFVLYLGPHIAKVTMMTSECNNQPGMPRVDHHDWSTCQAAVHGDVWMHCMFWGLGTALGELPPYFVARAARLSGDKVKELEVKHGSGAGSDSDDEDGAAERTKQRVLALVEHFGFWGILVFASIPNPLFDLAGLTCGHLLVPFTTFFAATAIGKAVIKVNIQSVFIITMFSENIMNLWARMLQTGLAQLGLDVDVSGMIEQRKDAFRNPNHDAVQDKPLFARLWDAFLILMIAYFLVSIVNSLVQGFVADQHEEMIKQKRKQLMRQAVSEAVGDGVVAGGAVSSSSSSSTAAAATGSEQHELVASLAASPSVSAVSSRRSRSKTRQSSLRRSATPTRRSLRS